MNKTPPLVDRPVSLFGCEVRIGTGCQSKILRTIPAPTDQSKTLALVNVTHHAVQAFSVCRSPPVGVGSQRTNGLEEVWPGHSGR
eukprot:5099609-Alexandrium_andersonii.AAC.1